MLKTKMHFQGQSLKEEKTNVHLNWTFEWIGFFYYYYLTDPVKSFHKQKCLKGFLKTFILTNQDL